MDQRQSKRASQSIYRPLVEPWNEDSNIINARDQHHQWINLPLYLLACYNVVWAACHITKCVYKRLRVLKVNRCVSALRLLFKNRVMIISYDECKPEQDFDVWINPMQADSCSNEQTGLHSYTHIHVCTVHEDYMSLYIKWSYNTLETIKKENIDSSRHQTKQNYRTKHCQWQFVTAHSFPSCLKRQMFLGVLRSNSCNYVVMMMYCTFSLLSHIFCQISKFKVCFLMPLV